MARLLCINQDKHPHDYTYHEIIIKNHDSGAKEYFEIYAPYYMSLGDIFRELIRSYIQNEKGEL